jgi:hypothetical protein
MLCDHPEIWQTVGDLGKLAEQALLDYFCGGDLLLRESVTAKLNELKSDLTEGSAAPLDRLLVDRIGLAWLQLTIADTDAVRSMTRDLSLTLREDQARKRQESAQRLFASAVKSLAVVRKLLRPVPSPVDIATRQKGSGRSGDRQRMEWPAPRLQAQAN